MAAEREVRAGDSGSIGPWILMGLRLFVAAILLLTGIGKLLDVPGFALVIRTYEFFPHSLELVIAATMVVIELRLAEWLLRGKGVGSSGLSEAGFVAMGLHLAFTIWAIIALVRGLQIENCGCFGVFWARPLTWQTVFEDLIMTAASAGIWLLARRHK